MILAQAIAESLHGIRPDWEVRLMDAASELDDELLKRLFPRITLALNRRSFRTSIPKAAAFLDEYKPDLVMSTR